MFQSNGQNKLRKKVHAARAAAFVKCLAAALTISLAAALFAGCSEDTGSSQSDPDRVETSAPDETEATARESSETAAPEETETTAAETANPETDTQASEESEETTTGDQSEPEREPESKTAKAAYAVCVYGIGQDADTSGNAMGLTFGPAAGGDYTNSYVSHDVDENGEIEGTDQGTTESGNAYRCVHEDDWSTIISWNGEDPYVYEKCLENGCTHSVELDFSSMTSFQNDFEFTGSGDGPSVLFYELLDGRYEGENYEYQNLAWGSGDSFGAGWAASRARAMLNGASDITDVTSTDEDWNVCDSADIYTSSNCLLAAFPSELAAAIGERKTAYGASYDAADASYVGDKLFLFSTSELSADSSLGGTEFAEYNYHAYDALPSGGESSGGCYLKWTGNGNWGDDNAPTVGYALSDSAGGAKGKALEWWLRSAGSYTYNTAVGVSETGGTLGISVYNAGAGIAPGFALSR